jgi:N-acetylmuramoyl-L-alanine amidase
VPTVTALSHAERSDGLRLIFEVAPPPRFTVFTMSEPDRLVVDLPTLRWRVDEPPEIPFVASLRHGLFRPDRARIVLELSQPLGVERAYVEPPEGEGPARLVLDLLRLTRAEFDARAGVPEGARWARRAGRAAPPLVTTRPGEVVVAIDPGHGGIDPGAWVGGLVEKRLVLEFARLLAAEIEMRPGFRAVLTRDDDVFVPLAERVARAHDMGAHLMISVHADVLEQGRARGVSAYTLSGKGTDEAADALAARENRSDVLAGADLGGETDELTRLLVELAQRGTGHESARLARSVLDAVASESEVLRSRPHREAGFRVLKAPDMPSILLELGFMDDPEDRRRLGDPEWLARTARSVSDGIAAWRSVASPGFVAPR